MLWCQRDCGLQLLTKGADINARDSFGTTPLMQAAFCGRTSIVAMLINACAKVTLADLEGRTALHSAASCGHGQCTGALLEAGADLSARDLNGETALDLGQRAKKCKAAAVLKQWAKGKIKKFLLTGDEDCEDCPWKKQNKQTLRSQSNTSLAPCRTTHIVLGGSKAVVDTKNSKSTQNL